jgi:hypothetical protein
MSDDSVSDTKHSPEPWGAFRLDVSGTDEFKAYTARCIDQGAPEDFYVVMVEKPDGPADVCHVGNGPTSAENARRIVACVNACAGIATEALEAGKMGEALDAAAMALRFASEDIANAYQFRGSTCGAVLQACYAVRALGRS